MTPNPMLALLVPLFVTACTNSLPCSDCPAVGGVWNLQYLAPDLPCDGGFLGEPPTTVQFTQEGSVVRGAIDGVQLTGTVYDTFELSLSGQQPGGGLAVSFYATYVAGGADGGDETLRAGRLARSTDACRDDRRFTGARY